MGIAPETWPAALRTLIRSSNKHLLNPLMLRLAGRRFWYASVITHVGRRSRKVYRTPIVSDRLRDDVIIPLPYGTQVDWVRNVMSSGEAVIVTKGRSLRVVSPEIIDATQALPMLSRHRRRAFERFHISHFLRMSVAS